MFLNYFLQLSTKICEKKLLGFFLTPWSQRTQDSIKTSFVITAVITNINDF